MAAASRSHGPGADSVAAVTVTVAAAAAAAGPQAQAVQVDSPVFSESPGCQSVPRPPRHTGAGRSRAGLVRRCGPRHGLGFGAGELTRTRSIVPEQRLGMMTVMIVTVTVTRNITVTE